MENSVEERQAEQGKGRAAVRLGGADQAGKLPVERGLLGEQPANDPAHRLRRARRARHAKWRALREHHLGEPDAEKNCDDDRERGHEPHRPRAHGHSTSTLVANCAPQLPDADSELKKSSPTLLSVVVEPTGFCRVTRHCAGAPASANGFFSA